VKEFNSDASKSGKPCLAEMCVKRNGKLLSKGYPLKVLIPELKADSDSFRCYIVAPIDEHKADVDPDVLVHPGKTKSTEAGTSSTKASN